MSENVKPCSESTSNFADSEVSEVAENGLFSARKSLKDNNFQFRSFAESPNMYESARSNAKGKAAPPVQGVHAVPRLGFFGAGNPEHIGSICQRVLEAWGRRVEP